MDKEFKKQIIAEAQPLIDKINALKKEVGEADEQEEKAKNEPSEEVKGYIEDQEKGRWAGKPLNGNSQTTESNNSLRNLNLGQ